MSQGDSDEKLDPIPPDGGVGEDGRPAEEENPQGATVIRRSSDGPSKGLDSRVCDLISRLGYDPDRMTKNDNSGASSSEGLDDDRFDNRSFREILLSFGRYVSVTDTSETPRPYQLRKDRLTGETTLYLPSNILNLIAENQSLSLISVFALVADFKIRRTSIEAKTTRATADTLSFWKSFVGEIIRNEVPDDVHFRGGRPGAQGSCAARVQLLKAYLQKRKRIHLYQFVSPAIYESAGDNKVEVLTVFLKQLQITDQGESAYLESTMRTLIMAVADVKVPLWERAFDNYKIPVNEAIKGLHKTKEKTDTKTKKKSLVSVTPKRPSERAEVLCVWERELLRAYEDDVFGGYKTHMSEANDQKGVSLLHLEQWRIETQSLITKAWDIVGKFSAHLTKRRTEIAAIVKKMDRKAELNLSTDSLRAAVKKFYEYCEGDDKEFLSFVAKLNLTRSVELIDDVPADIRSALVGSRLKVNDQGHAYFDAVSDVVAEHILESIEHELWGVPISTVLMSRPDCEWKRFFANKDDAALYRNGRFRPVQDRPP